MSAIKNVTVVGASGNLGVFVLDKLIASNKFNVQVLKRAGSSSTYPTGAVVEADFADLESLKTALKGQDAVVSTVSDAGVASQKLLIDAAIAVGVKRFIPSNFGTNLANPDTRKLPVFPAKVAIEDYLVEKSKTTDLTYTFYYTGPFVDFGIEHNFLIDLSNSKPTLYDGGDSEFSGNSLPTIGEAVASILTKAAETQNRAVYTSEIVLSQNQILSVAKRLAPNKPWAPETVDLNALAKSASERFLQGQHDFGTIAPILLRSILGQTFTENDNELLGIKGKTEEYLVELVAPKVK